MVTKSRLLAGCDRSWLDEDQEISPAGPVSGDPGPQQSVRRVDPRSTSSPLVNAELVAQATVSLCMDRLDRSQVEIKASRDTRTGFITLDHSCKKNPKRPQIEASRRKVQEMQRIRVLGNDNRPFRLCLPSCCRSVSGLLPTCYRRVSDVFSTCSP